MPNRRTPPPDPPTPQQTAQYTYDMLMSLKEIASGRGQETLVVLLAAAAEEARVLAQVLLLS